MRVVLLALFGCSAPYDTIELTLPGSEAGETLAVGDFDDDGQDDLAIGSFVENTVYVLHGPIDADADIAARADRVLRSSGGSYFGEQVSTASTPHGDRLLVMDADWDTGGIRVFGPRDTDGDRGTLLRYPEEGPAQSLQMADAVGGPAPDLVVVDGSGWVQVFEGPVSRGDTELRPLLTNARVPVVLANIDGDDDMEVFSLRERDFDWQIVLHADIFASQFDEQAGTVLFTSSTPVYSLSTFGDLDGDGFDDLVWQTDAGRSIALSPISPGSEVTVVDRPPQHGYPRVPFVFPAMPVGDVDGDHHIEWAEGGATGGRSAVYLIDATGEQHAVKTRQTSYSVTAIAAGDLDGDGEPDFALGYGGEDRIDLYLSRRAD